MERDPDLGEEHLDVLPTQARHRRFAHFDEKVAREQAGLGVDPRESEVVVLGLEVYLLLLGEEDGEPGDDGCSHVRRLLPNRGRRENAPSVVRWTIAFTLPSIRTTTWLLKMLISRRTVTEVPARGTRAVEM